MEFAQEHHSFIQEHLRRRTGERRGRLERGHREAEKLFCQNVWWPLRGSFADLHPEYEVTDLRGWKYYCDFAWLTAMLKLIIEIKGFGPHVRDMDRQKYCNELNRETFLTAMGFQVISFAYDDVASRPDLCITLLRMVLSRYEPTSTPVHKTAPLEKELIRLAYRLGSTLRPVDVERHLGLNPRTSARKLHSLSEKGILLPVQSEDNLRTMRYTLKKDAYHLL
ncbi:DUF559 domain-containing protein [Paenibacillus daejeonensis]|uniref:DUF559 domain-containing protein n=1 Tax=Paenibacillus daejeonensis TaxID=135193 RepID=UPI00037D6D3A|nr:DUF559 domain-containing protein [Paenibacillus daejeonensis]